MRLLSRKAGEASRRPGLESWHCQAPEHGQRRPLSTVLSTAGSSSPPRKIQQWQPDHWACLYRNEGPLFPCNDSSVSPSTARPAINITGCSPGCWLWGGFAGPGTTGPKQHHKLRAFPCLVQLVPHNGKCPAPERNLTGTENH